MEDDQHALKLYELFDDVNRDLIRALTNNDSWHRVALYLQERVQGRRNNQVTSAEKLLQELRMKEYTVGQLASILDQLKLEEPLLVLMDHEPVNIYQHPLRTVRICARTNNTFELECRANGFPYPRYQWMKRDAGSNKFFELSCQTQCVLPFSPIRLQDSGIYKCRVHNQYEDNISVEDSETTEVHIFPDPCSPINSSSLPDVPSIILQPVAPSPRLEIGTSLILEVTAICKHPMQFKWFKNKRELKGATSKELVIKRIESDGAHNSWSYQCQVYTEFGDSVMSDEVRFSLDIAKPTTQFTAEDKVALVIGNGDYKYLEKLQCAVNDVVTLSSLLTSLGFKVIAMYNLTKKQMEMVISWFCDLLENGIYAVFYYAGHGYELKKQCYMLPVDAPSMYLNKHALPADYVQEKIQLHCPALCLMLLDMCRKQADGHPDLLKETVDYYTPAAYPNMYTVYATTASRGAYEMKGEPNGIFMKYLKDHITKEDSLKDIFDRVKKEVIAHPLAGSQQFPWEENNLPYDRKLTDAVDPIRGEKRRQRIDFFDKINTLPSDTSVPFDNMGISVSLTFYKLHKFLHNGLCIVATVTHAANAPSLYEAFVTTANAEVEWGPRIENGSQRVIKYNIIHNLQNLQEPLDIDIILTDVLNQDLKSNCLFTVNCASPLVAGLLPIGNNDLES